MIADLRNCESSNTMRPGMNRKVLEKPAPEGAHAETLRRFKAEVFQVLGHPTRIHIIEVLRNKELPVSAILEQVGVEAANLSQHLTVLRSRRLVLNRKEGNQVMYSLRDPMLTEVLDTMKRL